MSPLINPERPPAFCPGCSHERVVHALDRALAALKLAGEQVVIVSDIGCSGLFDTFFNTHALHGLHGRALTYATGIKLARPDLTVVVTMGDGGLGIGGAHLLSACRRNLDLTLLVLNNFNYGMTGGQCSATTPTGAHTSSAFLSQLEKPLDVCQVAASAGAPYAERISAYQKNLDKNIKQAVAYTGFALMDIWGICPGRYTKDNALSPKQLEAALATLPAFTGKVTQNQRPEYGAAYREVAADQPAAPEALTVPKVFNKPFSGRLEVLLIGRAGQHVRTAGEILCRAALTAGMHATQKDDFPITVLQGHSISEVVLSDTTIGYSGIEKPDVVLVFASEGLERCRKIFSALDGKGVVITASGIELPDSKAAVTEVDYRALGVRSRDWALAGLAVMARQQTVLSLEMLHAAIGHRFKGPIGAAVRKVVDKVTS